MAQWLESMRLSVAHGRQRRRGAVGACTTIRRRSRVCDIRMPGHDGLWLAQQIRQDAPETAVIMATGVHDVGAAVLSLRQGVIDYLTKPFGRDRLREAVTRGLEWHRVGLRVAPMARVARAGDGRSAVSG